jgi:hypothetical protein
MGRMGLLGATIALLASAAGAQEMHVDREAGFEVPIPEGFAVVAEGEDYVGMMDATAELSVQVSDFADMGGTDGVLDWLVASFVDTGWAVSGEERRAGAGEFVARHDGRMVYTRVLALCEEDRIAMLRLDVPEAESRERNVQIGEIGRYFDATGC